MADLTALPESFAAGTTVEYTRSLPDYPANDGWTLAVVLSGRDRLEASVAASGADFVVTLSATATAALHAGLYTWAERVTKAGVTKTVGQDHVTVTPDVMAAAAGELESADERELRLVIDLIEGREAKGIEAFQVVNRSVNYTSLPELWKRRAFLENRIARAKRSGQLGRNHLASFRESA